MRVIIRECEMAGLPRPDYFYDMSGFFVVFKKDRYDAETLRELGLNERQIKAVLYVKETGKITNTDYQKINTVSKRTASNELTEVVNKYQILQKSGIHGVGISYNLKGQ